jgi:glycosyltransferase involved in cell wall biosynthesis
MFYADDPQLIIDAEKRFGLSLKGIHVLPPIFETNKFFAKLSATQKLDVLFFCSDGSIPVSFAKKTFLIFQFPTPWVQNSLITKVKLFHNTKAIVYSRFVKEYIEKQFPLKTIILPPSITLTDYHEEKKEKIILTVGRFTKGMNHKRQDILIEAFKKIVDSNIADWKLIIAGGVLPEDQDYVEKLQESSLNYPIEFYPNISRKELLALYGKATIYWHAAGFGVDVEATPQFVEHFGITTLEAMASGVIPLVYPAGGQEEMVQDSKNGFFWETIEELTIKTVDIISNKKIQTTIRNNAKAYVVQFDHNVFKKRLEEIIHN